MPLPVIVLRFIEGIGAGFFIAAGMSYINSRPDHTRMSGYYLAMLNLGLVIGLIASGWLAVRFMQPALGIGVFTALSLGALVAVFSSGRRKTTLTWGDDGHRNTCCEPQRKGIPGNCRTCCFK